MKNAVMEAKTAVLGMMQVDDDIAAANLIEDKIAILTQEIRNSRKAIVQTLNAIADAVNNPNR